MVDCNSEVEPSKPQSSAAESALAREVDSLRVVMEMRNDEIAKLKQSNADLQKQVTFCRLLCGASPSFLGRGRSQYGSAVLFAPRLNWREGCLCHL